MKLRYTYLILLTIIVPTLGNARIVSLGTESSGSRSYEIPRSQIKTYIQRGSIEENLRTVKTVRPSSFSDEEVLAIPERYLTPQLKERKKEIITNAKAQIGLGGKKAPSGAKVAPKISDKVKIRSRSSERLIEINIQDTVWVPETATKSSQTRTVLAPEQRLAQVELIESISIEASKEIRRELNPGERDEIKVLFDNGKSTDKYKEPLNLAAEAYLEGDYATSVTLSLEVIDAKKTSKRTKELAQYLLAHSLFQSGFYSSALSQLVSLSTSSLRRSVVGMSAEAIERTRDDAAANQILSQVSLSQIPEKYQPLYAFHFGRILLNTGALDAALAAFAKVSSGHSRYPEAQYYMGVIRASSVSSSDAEKGWENDKSMVSAARINFEETIQYARANDAADLKNLAHLALARLAYQAKQFNQSAYHYQSVQSSSPFAREALYETAWALYRLGEFNRSLGGLHALGSSYYESKDFPELWILRSLNYLKLCRFDEANRAANTFEELSKNIRPEIASFSRNLANKSFKSIAEINSIETHEWMKNILNSDPVVKKDLGRERLLLQERARLASLRSNERIIDAELRLGVADALEKELDTKVARIASALRPYLIDRVSSLGSEYQGQQARLDMLRFEIYNQATKFPEAIDRPEAKKLLAKGEFLPGVFLKGHEILWRYNGELWLDEIKGYDYFIPTECLRDQGS
jgi:predicted negative regulator of RcsB-dependent stress response